MESGLKIRFWGTRLGVSTPGKATLEHGGNTPCVQILSGKKLIIIDAGFGINALGETLATHRGLDIHIFFSQFLLDRMQGLPFFLPIYFPENTIHLYSPHKTDILQKRLEIFFDHNYSPFEGLHKMPANIHCHNLTRQAMIEGFKTDFIEVNHGAKMAQQNPLAGFAYKFTFGKDVITVVAGHEAIDSDINQRLIAFARGSTVLVHDAAFPTKNLQFTGWGHSTIEQALSNAAQIGAGHTLLTNYAPFVTDAELHQVMRRLRQDPRFTGTGFALAKENTEYDVVPLIKRAAG